MGNLKNLTANQISMEEMKERNSKAGKASGKAKRIKADMKKAFSVIFEMEIVGDEERKKLLQALGVEPTYGMLLALATFLEATTGNQKAVENIIKLNGLKDSYDIAEQRAKTQLLKIKIEHLKAQIQTSGAQEEKIDKLFNLVDETLKAI